MAKGRIIIDEALCKGCGLCIPVCPKAVIFMAQDRFTANGYRPAALVDPEGLCTGCAICALICPEAAITIYRSKPVKM